MWEPSGFSSNLTIEYSPGTQLAGRQALHDSFVGYQFYIPSLNLAAEDGKRAPNCAADFGWLAGKSGELLGIQKNVIDSMRLDLSSTS